MARGRLVLGVLLSIVVSACGSGPAQPATGSSGASSSPDAASLCAHRPAGSTMYSMAQESMVPTLAPGDVVVVGPPPSDAAGFHRGEVVTFVDPGGSESVFLKRIVGLPGEKVEIAAEAGKIDGQTLAEPYLSTGMKTTAMGTLSGWQLGPQDLFVLGDGRDRSQDSRSFGPIAVSAVKGHALAICAPAARVANLP